MNFRKGFWVVGKFVSFIVRELREMTPPFLFFMVVFHMLAITKGVLQSGHDVTVLRSVVATIMALTVARSMLLYISVAELVNRYGREVVRAVPGMGIVRRDACVLVMHGGLAGWNSLRMSNVLAMATFAR